VSLHDLQDAKEQIRQAVDIVDLVGSYMALRRQGRNFVGLCPWHDDSRPSFQVNPERQSFKCWVCDVGGDVFSFIMRAEGLEFREAFEMLADRAGIELRTSAKQGEQASQFDRRNLLAALAWAEREFHEFLLKSPAAEIAREYLFDRGISDESIRRFHLGFTPDSWQWLLDKAKSTNFSPAVLERVGLILKSEKSGSYYDRFRGRLLFSIRDARSRCIAFGGRILPGVTQSNPDRTEAKYINSPETPLFSKSTELYALDMAREAIAKEQGLVVMEGYTDVIMAHQHGITNAVAVLGTALGEKHIPLVRRFTDSVTLVLDGDEAGQRRTMQILDDLLALFVAHEIDLRILTLPGGADPCDVISSQGSEAFRERLTKSLDALDHKIFAVTNGLESAPGTHRTALAVERCRRTSTPRRARLFASNKSSRVSQDNSASARKHSAHGSRLFAANRMPARRAG
jgi:DNA primase